MPIDGAPKLFVDREFDLPGRVVEGTMLVSFIVKFRRRSMKYVAIRTARRRKIQAPIIPPSSFAFIPEEGVDTTDVSEVDEVVVVAGNFAIGVGRGLGNAGVGVAGL